MSKSTEMAAKWRGKLASVNNAQTLRRVADAAEGAAGSFVGGYVQGRYPLVGGVPTAAAIALVGITAGIALEQDDVTAVALGVGNSYLTVKGFELGAAAAGSAGAAGGKLYTVGE